MDNPVNTENKRDMPVLADIVFMTNKIIYRWVHANNVKLSHIKKSDVDAIFYGFIKKWIVRNRYDFKNICRCINIFLDENMYISNLGIADTGYYIRDTGALNALKTAVAQINFEHLIPTADNNYISNEEIADLELVSIDFTSIKSIKF